MMDWSGHGLTQGDEGEQRALASAAALGVAIAAAADLCLQPWRHAVIPLLGLDEGSDEIHVRVEARNTGGERQPEHDVELEIYRSGRDLNVMVSWCEPPDRPMLWHGRHPVWMDGDQGQRCERPADGAPLEAFSRRLRALLLD